MTSASICDSTLARSISEASETITLDSDDGFRQESADDELISRFLAVDGWAGPSDVRLAS